MLLYYKIMGQPILIFDYDVGNYAVNWTEVNRYAIIGSYVYIIIR